MNTVLITVSIIAFCIVILIQYTNIVKLTRKVNDITEEKIKAEVQVHDVVKVAKSILYSIYNEAGILPTDRLPFVSKENFLSIKKTPLDSIRLRLKDGKVSIYKNGIINPTKDVVVLDDITSLNDEHVALIQSFLTIIEKSDMDTSVIPLTPQKITHILTYNTNPFKK